jgi:hypothetical protein
MDTIEVLKEAVEKSGTADAGAMFALLDATLCDLCCSSKDGGNSGCMPA